MAGVQSCIKTSSFGRTVTFDGTPINLGAIAEAQGLTKPYLSLVFSGKRYPSIPASRKIAEALGMEWTEFIAKLDNHLASIR